MPDLKAQLAISADASGVEAGVNKAKRSLADLGATASAAGKQAAASLDSMGAGGAQSAQKVDAATRSMIGSIQRTTAALDAGSRTSAKYFETLAQQRGVDVNTLKPYLDQLDAVAAKQKNVGVSAAQTAAAMRGVPAQVTDIVTSLQGGQKPLTVLLQQGGQLKDMFGGIGPAARALGSYVVGLINPFTLAAAAAGALAFAYSEGSKEADAYAKAIILSGNAAGTNVSQLQEMAKHLAAVSGTQADAADALAQFAASGNIAGESLERFSGIALKMERETGQAVSETVKQFAELGKAPVDASIKLNETTNFLTASIFQQIKALEDQGKTADAAALAQKAYADALDTRLGQINGRLGTVERSWRGIVSAAKSAWDAMLNVGREQSNPDQLSSVSSQIDAARTKLERLNKLGPGKDNQLAIASAKAQLDSLLQVQYTLQENARLENRAAEAQAAAAERTKARIAFDKEGDKYLSSRAKMEKEITEARNKGAAAGASQAEIDKRIADIRASHKDVVSSGLQVDKAQLGLDIEAIKKANDQLVGSYTNSEKIMEAQRAAGLLSDSQYYEAKREFIRLEAQAQEDALTKEIARYQQEKLSGKAKLDNDKKIADAQARLATVRADASAKQEVLTDQEEAAAKRLQLSYLTARQAAQDYFDTLARQQQREVEGVGKGSQQRSFDAGVNQIEDRYAGQRRDLENHKAQLELEGKFTDDARAQYEQRLAIINEFQGKSIASYAGYYSQLLAKQADWSNGATEALQNYLDTSHNVAAQTEHLFTNSFQGMEDALVSFVATGKLSFSSLAQSIIADMARIQAKKLIAGLADSLGSLFRGGFGTGNAYGNQDLGGFFADGGDPPVGKVSVVGERGPELFIPKSAGTIVPNEALKGIGGGVTINNAPVYNIDSRSDRAQVRADMAKVAQQSNADLVERLQRMGVLG